MSRTIGNVKAAQILSEYTGKHILPHNVETADDPGGTGTAVRWQRRWQRTKKQAVYFLLFWADSTEESGKRVIEVEEVEFTQWPPKSRGIRGTSGVMVRDPEPAEPERTQRNGSPRMHTRVPADGAMSCLGCGRAEYTRLGRTLPDLPKGDVYELVIGPMVVGLCSTCRNDLRQVLHQSLPPGGVMDNAATSTLRTTLSNAARRVLEIIEDEHGYGRATHINVLRNRGGVDSAALNWVIKELEEARLIRQVSGSKRGFFELMDV